MPLNVHCVEISEDVVAFSVDGPNAFSGFSKSDVKSKRMRTFLIQLHYWYLRSSGSFPLTLHVPAVHSILGESKRYQAIRSETSRFSFLSHYFYCTPFNTSA